MRPGLRFQTKLILSMIGVIIVVTIALMMATSSKVRTAYTRQFSEEFEHLVGRLEDSRKERSQEFMEFSRELAQTPAIASFLKGEKEKANLDELWQKYLAKLTSIHADRPDAPGGARKGPGPGKQGPDKKPQFSPELIQRVGFLAVLDNSGNFTPIVHPKAPQKRQRLSRRMNVTPEKTWQQLLGMGDAQDQHVLYIPVENQDGKEQILEMVSTVVRSPETGEIIGRFLRSSTAETEAERSLDRFQREFESDQRLKSGIFLDGQVYGRNLSLQQAEEMGRIVTAELQENPPGSSTLRFESELRDSPYYFYVTRLNEESKVQEAFQVAAFPMANLESDLANLRTTGSGIGIFAVLFGGALAYLLGRNLAEPINELSRGTKAIKEGNLDCHLKVKGNDELGELTASFNEMVGQLKQKAIFRELLGKISDESVAQAMISGTLDLELGGEIKDVSVLFCDIRGFTRRTENMHPGDVIELLNEHMTAMTKVVRSYYGVVDKFVGDEVMAVFGGLKSHGNDAHYAAACAREMIAERERLNEHLEVPIEIGVGIASGEVVAGCMGSADRLNYTVLGSKVNLAARLCNAADRMEAVVDKATVDQISPAPTVEHIADLQLKGFTNPVEAYRLSALAEPEMINEPVPQTGQPGQITA